jgi:hypothetical protein
MDTVVDKIIFINGYFPAETALARRSCYGVEAP